MEIEKLIGGGMQVEIIAPEKLGFQSAELVHQTNIHGIWVDGYSFLGIEKCRTIVRYIYPIEPPHVHETPKSDHDLEACTEKEEKPLPNLDFTSLFNYVKSVQVAFGLTDDEASTFFYVINMWQMKKVYDPEFKIQNHD